MHDSRRLLLATDFGPGAEALTAACTSLSAADPSLEVVVLHALEDEIAAEHFARTEAACRALGRRITAGGGRASSTVAIRLSTPEDLILASAEELSAALVVLGWGREQRLGSAARGVIRAARCPVLLVGAHTRGFDLAEESGLPGVLERINGRHGVHRVDVRDHPPLARLALVAGEVDRATPSSSLLVLAAALTPGGV